MIVIWMARTIDWQSQLKIILYAGAIAGILSVAFAIGLPSRGIDYTHGTSWQGIFYSKNHLGRMMLIFLTLLLLPHRSKPGPARVSNPLQLHCALSRPHCYVACPRQLSSVAAIYLVFTAAMFLSRRLRAMDRKFLILGMAVLLSVSALLILPNLTALVLEMGGDPTLTGRTVIWSQLLISFWKHPWTGYGYGAFWGAGRAGLLLCAFMAPCTSRLPMRTVVTSMYCFRLGGVGLALVLAMVAKATYTGLRELGGDQAARVEWCCAVVFISVIYNVDEVTYVAAKALPWIMLLLACLNLYTVQQEQQAAAADVPQKELAYESTLA